MYWKVAWLDHTVISMFFNFLRNAAPFYIPTISDKVSNFSTSWPTLDAFFFFFLILSHLNMGVKWYLTVVLIGISLMISDVESLFLLAVCIFFGKISIQLFYSLLNWVFVMVVVEL